MANVKWARERAGLGLSEMAVLLEMKKQSVADFESRDVARMSLYHFERYFRALDYKVKIEVTALDGEVFPMETIVSDSMLESGKRRLRRKKGVKKTPAKKASKKPHITVKGETLKPTKGALPAKRQAKT